MAWTKRSFSRFVDAVSRYGYSPGRVLATYAATVLIFGVIYRLFGVTRWRDAVPFSLIAFHGRGVINGNIASDSVLLWIPAISVQEHFRKQGIGSALLRRLRSEGMGRGVHDIVAIAEADKRDSVSLFGRLGWSEDDVSRTSGRVDEDECETEASACFPRD